MRLLPLLAIACVIVSCAPPLHEEIDFNANSPEFTRFDDPFSVEETRSLRDGFSWRDTSALPEVDSDGHPALFYMIAYVGSDDDVTLLDAMGQHSPLPLFAAERTRWEGQSGQFGFLGDASEGLFHFAIIPAETYNATRALALEDRPPFRAMILRDIPVAEARNEDGSLDYAWAVERGFRLRMDDEGSAQSMDGLTTEPLIFEILALLSREVRDEADGVAGDLTRTGRDGLNTVTISLGSTDTTHPRMTRAWGDNHAAGRTAGASLTLPGVEVIVEFEVGIARRRANDDGVAVVPVAVGSRATFCVRAQNDAVQVDELFEASQVCAFTQNRANDDGRITLRITHPVFNVVAQFTDAREYSRRVLGYQVSHRASVLIGPWADVYGAGQTGGARAFALCGGFQSVLNLGWFSLGQAVANTITVGSTLSPGTSSLLGISAPVLAIALPKIMAHDIFFPQFGTPVMEGTVAASHGWSRGVPTHEYGHFLSCDMLSSLGGDGDYLEGWGDVIFSITVGSGQVAGAENLELIEGIADYFASQVVGGTNYLQFASVTDGRWGGGCFYADPREPNALEENIGGRTQRTQPEDLNGGRLNPGFYQNLGVATSLLHDATDGPSAFPLPAGVSDSNSFGAFFAHNNPDVPRPVRFSPASPLRNDAMDESVNLTGRMLPDLFREMSTRGNTFNRRNFYGALSAVARRDHSAEEVCDMFGIHTPSGLCTELVPPEPGFTPAEPLITTASVDSANNITWGWRDISSAATGYALEIVRDDGTFAVPRTNRRYARADEFVQRGVEFDRRFTLRIATVNDTLRSEFAERSVQSFAEPVRNGSGTALRGAVRLEWTAVRATSYAVHDVTGGRDIVVAQTSDTSITLRGLLGGVERTYRIVSENALGLPSEASPDIRVTPLPPAILYVATFGNDAAVGAGSALQPFRTVRAALAQATATGADEVILHEGLFEETGPLVVGTSITLRGGYRAAGGVWTDVDAVSSVEVTGGASVTACSTLSFNQANAPTTAAITFASGTSVALVNVDVTGVRATVPLTQCFTTLHATNATLSIERSNIATTLGSCSAALVAIGGTLNLSASELRGAAHRAVTLPSNLDVTAVAACDGTQIVAENVTLSGTNAPTTTSGEIVSASAVSGRAIRSLRVQRSFLRALIGNDAWSAIHGRLTSVQVTAMDSVFVANSVIRTPHGGDDNRAFDVGGEPSVLRSLRLYHDTFIVGSDWEAALPAPLPSYGAVVSLRGDVESVDMFNNVLSYAGGGVDLVDGTHFTGVDRTNTTADPSFFNFAGNAVSVPYTSNWHLASLAQCFSASEFGMTVTEPQLNSTAGHECHGGARSGWVVRNNIAFNGDRGLTGDRPVFSFAEDGYPDVESRSFIFFNGEVIESLPLASEVRADIQSRARTDSRSCGAWVGDGR